MDRILIDLDKVNPKFARPNTFCANTAFLPFALSTCSMFLAVGAAPHVEVFRNPLFLVCFVICILSVFLFIIPRIFKWDWKAEYFGVSVIYLGSVALLGAIPWGSILLYSKLPIVLRVVGFLLYLFILIGWAWRFVVVYRSISGNAINRQRIYVESDALIYYRQKTDVRILEKEMRFRQFPNALFVIIFMFGAVLTIPNATYLKSIVGLPFTHLFLAIAAIPTDMMAIGLVTRGFIVYYVYPRMIFKESGKRVFVDLVSR
jgi:hypothetical protein